MQKTFNRICIGIIIGLVFCVMLLGYGYRYERGRAERYAEQYLDAVNRGQELINGLEDRLIAQTEELHRINIENSQLRIERERLRKEIFGIGEQISELGKIELHDYDRISRLEEIMDRIIAIIRGLQEKSRGQN